MKPRTYRHGPTRLLDDFEQLKLLQLIIQYPGIYLHELQEKLMVYFGVSVGVSTICRTLKYMGCSRQVIRHVAIQRSDSLRAKFMAPYSPDLNPVEIVFSKVKGIMKANNALFQVCSSPRALLSVAFGMVTTDDCISYCGYMWLSSISVLLCH